MRISAVIFTSLLCWISPAQAEPAQRHAWGNVDRVVAVGDIHGAYNELTALLQGNGIIDATLRWQAGATHVVSLGDILDRGPDSRKVMDLFMRLQTEAAAAGGRLHVLLGNHELMNLSGDLRDVSAAEFDAFEGPAGHSAAFAPGGHYGRWLLTLPIAVRINDTLFVHGGLSPLLAGQTLAGINLQFHKALRTLLAEAAELTAADDPAAAPVNLLHLPAQLAALASPALLESAAEPLFGATGPLWYRGNAVCHPLLEAPNVTARLEQFDINRIVIGHTPTAAREVTSRFAGSVVMIDTGMLSAVYKGNARLLEIIGDKLRVLGASGDQHAVIPAGKSSGEAKFVALNKNERRRAQAAYLLDRLLGINMVPETVEQQVDGRKGIALTQPARFISEAARVERGQYRPNHCYQSSAYELLAAFDALLGMRSRSADNLFYALPGWQLHLGDTHLAFGTSAALPNYAQPPALPQAFAVKIAPLSQAELEKEFDGLLKKNEIRALIKRRDAILSWPRSSP